MKENSEDRAPNSSQEAPLRRTPGGRVILVRHGESEGNRTRTFTHSPEVDLTARGREQARATAELVAQRYRPLRIVSSPYKRALETARIIAGVLDLPVEVEPDWREQSLGQLAGRPYDCVLEDPKFDPSRTWAWRPPDGESLDDVKARVAPALDALMRASRGQVILLVSHAGVMQAIWAHVTGNWEGTPVPGNAAVAVLEHRTGRRATIGFEPEANAAGNAPHGAHRATGQRGS